MSELILIRYGELGLKGKNRAFFENQLQKNIRLALSTLGKHRIYRTWGRLFVEIDSEDRDSALSKLQNIFGIASISPVLKTSLDMAEIKTTALSLMQSLYHPGETFKVESRRANKSFPLKSPEISREVSAYILQHLPDLPVDVHNPQRTLQVEIRDEKAYIFTEAYPGAGGLPVGVTGKALLLLSGGIDSPVAGYLALKRGVKLEALHFYSFPFTGERSKEKVLDLCSVLARYGGNINLHIAHFTEIQKAIRKHCPAEWSVIIMRRMMLRIAAAVAEIRKAGSLFTGENLGQVASQTMESIAVIEKVANLPIFRPLIGFDKKEIIALAEKIDTYSISIRPYEDCCTIFVPKRPIIRPSLEQAEKIEKNFDFKPLLEKCLHSLETIVIN